MGDFKRALASLGARHDKPISPHLFPSLKDQLALLKTRTVTHPDPLPPGDSVSTPYGSHYVVRAHYPHDHFHGKVRLGRFSLADLEQLMALMGAEPSAAARDEIAFLDTETTGMQGGTGICPFLVGVGFFEGDEFQMIQYFIRDFDEEPAMLHTLGQLLSRFKLLITYNGAAFDVPLLETRFTLARQENPFAGMAHYDLLATARRLWRNGHGSCRLVALEEKLLSFSRGHDVPGAMIPRAYFDYLHHDHSPALRGVFTHNLHDVVSLAALTLHACDRIAAEPAPLDEPLDLFSLAHVLENSPQLPQCRHSIDLYQMALRGGLPEPFRLKALETLSVLYRRAGDMDRSYQICAELMAGGEFSLAACEGAAIYFERHHGDLESALRVVEQGLEKLGQTDERKRPRILLYARWQRLQQRVIKGIL